MVSEIVCAVDDTEYSETAAEFAIQLASQLPARLTFYMVNPSVLPSPRGAPVYLWTDEYVRDLLDEAFRRAKQAGVDRVVCKTARAVSVARSIVDFAESRDADFIVIGASRHGGMISLLRQPISRRVADTAPCPVLIIGQVRNRDLNRGVASYSEAA
jgi:nucleotide-binding universal stress UspA family protein